MRLSHYMKAANIFRVSVMRKLYGLSLRLSEHGPLSTS